MPHKLAALVNIFGAPRKRMIAFLSLYNSESQFLESTMYKTCLMCVSFVCFIHCINGFLSHSAFLFTSTVKR